MSSTKNGSFLLVSQSYTRHGVAEGAIGIIYHNSKDELGISSKELVTLSYDAESGGCGRGSRIGIEKALEFVKYTIEKEKDSTIIALQLKEESCTTKSKANITRRFSITDKDVKEIE